MLFRFLDPLVSLVASLGDTLRHVRYRRGDLSRMTPVEMVDDRAAASFRWTFDVPVLGRPRAVLECAAGSRVAYDVMLPPGATIAAWCAVVPPEEGTSPGPGDAAEFEIAIQGQHERSSQRSVVNASSTSNTTWRELVVTAPSAGPARIVFTVRPLGTATVEGLRARWAGPRLETPRSIADLAADVRSAVAGRSLRDLWRRTLPANSDRLYKLWVRETEPSRRDLEAQRQWSAGQSRVFTLVTFVGAPSITGTTGDRRVIESLQRQSYPRWEWILVAPEDARRHVQKIAARVDGDARLTTLFVAPGTGRADAWNAALKAARGEFSVLLDPGDVLGPSALYEVARMLEQAPDTDLVYSDEDRISRSGARHTPLLKPDWSPEQLLSSNYIGRLAAVRVTAANAIGGFRRDVGADEWDLYLRLSRVSTRVRRVARCLYHRDEMSARHEDDRVDAAVVREHLRHAGLDAVVSKTPGEIRAHWRVSGASKVSIVIPNRDAADVLTQCVHGLLHETDYPHCEIVIVDNGSTDSRVLDLYRSLTSTGKGIVVPFNGPFNFSAACNAGAAAAHGDLLLFLNNDVEVIQPDWLEELVRWAERPEIGVVGAKLLFPDRTIQHAGVVFGLGLVGHIFSRAPEGTSGPFGSTESYRNYLAVTGACQMMRREVFQKLGGFDERLRLSFSDVLLCMKAWDAGYRVMYTPHARLIHHESYTRKRNDSAEDMTLFAQALRARGFVEDPYFHPDLNPQSSIPAVRPPFDPTPRQVVHDYVERVLAAAAAGQGRLS